MSVYVREQGEVLLFRFGFRVFFWGGRNGGCPFSMCSWEDDCVRNHMVRVCSDGNRAQVARWGCAGRAVRLEIVK